MPSTGTPTAFATDLIEVNCPVSPTNDGSNRSRYLRIAGPVSRAGLVMMKSICAWSRTGRSSVDPRSPFGSPAGVRMIAPPGLLDSSAVPPPQPARASSATAVSSAAAFLIRLTTVSTGDRRSAFPSHALAQAFGQRPHSGRAGTRVQRLHERRPHDDRVRVGRDGRGL